MKKIWIMLLATTLLLGCGGGEPVEKSLTLVTLQTDGSRSDLVVDSYFSLNAHGPTQLFRVWSNVGLVLHVHVSDSSGNSNGPIVTAHFLLFTGADRQTQMDCWINNQYSDALCPDVRTPLEFATNVSIGLYRQIGHETGVHGDLYDIYELSLEVLPQVIDLFKLPLLALTLPVYKLISPIPVPIPG
jgi:hypothetical protein